MRTRLEHSGSIQSRIKINVLKLVEDDALFEISTLITDAMSAARNRLFADVFLISETTLLLGALAFLVIRGALSSLHSLEKRVEGLVNGDFDSAVPIALQSDLGKNSDALSVFLQE